MSTLAYLKKMLKSKTVWLGILATILPYVGYYFTEQLTLAAAITNSVVGVLVIILRLVTTKPISEK